jgi:hypothetical protein
VGGRAASRDDHDRRTLSVGYCRFRERALPMASLSCRSQALTFGPPKGPTALKREMLEYRRERRDSRGRPALRVATRRYLRPAMLDEVRAHGRDGRAALFNVG